jgi:hypothetical protein
MRSVDTTAATVAALVSALIAVGAFIFGRRFIPPSDGTTDEQSAAGRVLVAFWLLAAIALTACLIFAYVAYLHGVVGSGAET